MTKVMIAGTFDNFHVGHQFLIAQAIEQGNEIVIIVARDKTVQKIKGRCPKNGEVDRLKKVEIYLRLYPSAISSESFSVRLGRSDADFFETIREEDPDMLLLGYDQRVDTESVAKEFSDLQIKRATAYKPDVFKSSKF